MITELERKIIEKAGMDVEDFEPRPVQTAEQNSDKKRIEDLERAIQILLGGDTDDT